MTLLTDSEAERWKKAGPKERRIILAEVRQRRRKRRPRGDLMESLIEWIDKTLESTP